MKGNAQNVINRIHWNINKCQKPTAIKTVCFIRIKMTCQQHSHLLITKYFITHLSFCYPACGHLNTESICFWNQNPISQKYLASVVADWKGNGDMKLKGLTVDTDLRGHQVCGCSSSRLQSSIKDFCSATTTKHFQFLNKSLQSCINHFLITSILLSPRWTSPLCLFLPIFFFFFYINTLTKHPKI